MGHWRGSGGPARKASIHWARVLGRQPGQLRVDLADHRPDLGDSRFQALRVGEICALAVGVELVDGLGHAPECGLVYRTHHRRLPGRRRPRASFRIPAYPQVAAPWLWITAVNSTA